MHDMKEAYISIKSDMLQASEGGLEAIEHWKQGKQCIKEIIDNQSSFGFWKERSLKEEIIEKWHRTTVHIAWKVPQSRMAKVCGR